MKIRLSVSDEKLEEVTDFLTEHGIELDDGSNYILLQKDMYPTHLTGRNADGEKAIIPVDEIITIESYGHTVELHTDSGSFTTADVSIAAYPAYADKAKTFTELSVVFEADGKTLQTVDLMKDKDVKRQNDTYSYHLNDALSNGKTVKFTILGKDALGYRYEMKDYVLAEDKDYQNNYSGEPGDIRFVVYAPDGTEVIRSNESPMASVYFDQDHVKQELADTDDD